jgi:predicted dehydrogenase
VIGDIGPHVFDMLNFLFDDFPVTVSAHCSTCLCSDVEEMCAFIAEYPQNRVGIGTISWQSPKVIEYTNMYGTGRSIHVSPKFFFKTNPSHVEEITLLRAALESVVTMKFQNLPTVTNQRGNPYQREINSFIDQVRSEGTSDLNALNALSVLLSCEATKKALEKKCRVEIPSPKQLY